MNNFYTRTITGLLFVTVIIGSILLGKYFFSGLFLLFTILGLNEFYRMVVSETVKPQKIAGIILGSIIYIIFFLFSNLFYPFTILLALVFLFPVFIIELYRKKENPVINISYTLLGIIFISVPFGILNLFYFPFYQTKYNELLLAFFFIIWINDTGAYITGSLMGKHKMFERISPKKTWEGVAGGAIFAIVLVFILSNYFKNFGLKGWIIFGLVTIIASTFGDLSESLLKRSIGVKDSGNIFPGHGGILDRFDSVLLAAPFSFLCVSILNSIINL